jgi:hypothetical protein
MADTYTVLSQQQVLDTSDVSNPFQAMQINFRTATSPGPFFVRVPLAQYTPQAVHDAIVAYVANIDAVANL